VPTFPEARTDGLGSTEPNPIPKPPSNAYQLRNSGFAGGTGPAVGEQYGKKVTICHHTQGKGGTKHVTIRVSRSALPAHLRHGDTLGACNTRANRVKHSTKAHAAKFHKPKAAQKGKRGKGKKG